eukprot:scaffold13.g359.t1
MQTDWQPLTSCPQFFSFSETNRLACVYFTAPWCFRCKALGEKIAGFPRDFEDVAFAQVDLDQTEARKGELGEVLDIKTLPTFILLKDGVEVHRVEGVLQQRPARALSLAVRRHLRGEAAGERDASNEDEEDEVVSELPKRRRTTEEEEGEKEAPAPAASRRKGGTQLKLESSQAAAALAGQPASPPASQSSRDAMAVLMAGSRKAIGRSGRATVASKTKSKAATRAAGAPTAAPTAAPPSPAAVPGALWADKHAPRSEGDLVVHKKKVEEVRQWLEGQRATLGQPGVPRALVMSGPPGCGKSAVLGALAGALGFEHCEWQPPTPTLFYEFQYTRSAGLPYTSKLDSFEEFVLRSKMPALSFQHSSSAADGGAGAAPDAGGAARGGAAAAAGGGRAGGGGRPKLVVVDDLPFAAGPAERERLAAALGDLARTSRFPLVICVTETSGKAQQERGLNAASGSFQGLHKDLVAVPEAAQAASISFNPITALNTAKALRAVLERERLSLPDAEVMAIAELANGDLRNALNTLQFVCTGQAAAPAKAPPKRGAKRKAAGGRDAAAAAAVAGAARTQVAFAGRDSMLSLFHALGKLLYNKRSEVSQAAPASAPAPAAAGSPGASEEPAATSAEGPASPSALASAPSSQQQQQPEQQQQPAGQAWTASGFWQGARSVAVEEEAQVADWCRRPPMQFDPEAVLAGAGLDAGTVAAFLHENLPHFVADPGVPDMAAALAYLSAADCVASSTRWGSEGQLVEDDLPASTLADAVAASVAARGVCFANRHPAPRRWLPLKAPAQFAAARAATANRAHLRTAVAPAWALHGGAGGLEPAGRLAAELLPMARAIQARSPDAARLQLLQPSRWLRTWEGKVYEQGRAGAGAPAPAASGEVGGSEGEGGAAAGQGKDSVDAIEPCSEEEDW